MLFPLYLHFYFLVVILNFFHLKKKKAKSDYIHTEITVRINTAAGRRRSRKQVRGGDRTALAGPSTLNRHGHTLRNNQASPPRQGLNFIQAQDPLAGGFNLYQ